MTSLGDRDRIGWKTQREQIDLAAIVTGLLGQAPGRAGDRGRRLWWNCPIHMDRNPSFMVEPGKPWWRCWGCGESGDAASLLMRLEGLSFLEAKARLTGRSALPGATRPRAKPLAPPEAKLSARLSGMPEGDALALVVESSARLWTHEGSEALAYLTGPRSLNFDTIWDARLGWTPQARIPKKEEGTYSARGIVIPWFDGDRLALVKVRQPEGFKPKYSEAFRDRPSIYPDPRVIQPGRPLIISEGEFDSLLLGQELGDLATIVTLGGTGSTKPEPGILGTMLPAALWFIATDADEAGDRAAARWEGTRARRVRPPEPFKDWTEVVQGGVELRRWWTDRLGGNEAPPLFSWDDLAGWRWGPALESTDIETKGPT